MSFHGGVIGTSLGILYLARKEKLPVAARPRLCRLLRAVRPVLRPLANFVNQELWGAPDRRAWAVRFPEVIAGSEPILGPPRHPSQLYEAGLEGIVLFAILWLDVLEDQARYEPGKLVGAFIFFYGLFRFGVEFVREPGRAARRLRRRRPACTWASGCRCR